MDKKRRIRGWKEDGKRMRGISAEEEDGETKEIS